MAPIASLFGATNDFHADPAQLAQSQYGGLIGQAGAQQGMARGTQDDFIKQLQARANGTAGASPAELMLQRAAQANGQQAAGMAASQRGLNPGLAARMGVDAMANANQSAAGQAGILRAGEQQNALGMLGSAIGQQRGQDIGLLGSAGGLQNAQNQTNVANTQGTNQINAGVAQGNANTNGQIAGGILGGIGKIAALANGGPVEPPLQAGIGDAMAGLFDRGRQALGDAVSGLAVGGPVPGQANAPGDSPKNDTVPAMLSPGEVVLPRTIADDPEGAASFVRAIRRRKEAAQSGAGYGRVLASGAKAYFRGGPC